MARRGICHQCWPNGWPYNSSSASCAHGDWVRSVPKAEKPAYEAEHELAAKSEPAPEAAPEE
ncbi:hypothetical protein [Streptomyces mirabilis]|uniref:hypothetical protein n=1 Tax=Streptomyces mirabilis TaxID=68239 RepID=UPI003689C6FA